MVTDSYRMVMVMAPCRRDMVTDLSYRMVKVIAPCRKDMVLDLKSKMVVVVALCRRDMVLDLNNKMDSGGGLVQEGHGTRSQQDGCSGGQGMGAARAGKCEWAKLRQRAGRVGQRPGWSSGLGCGSRLTSSYYEHLYFTLKCLLEMNKK